LTQSLIFPAFVPAAVASTVACSHSQNCIQTPSCGRIEWSDFLGNRIDSSSESNRTDSNRELECTALPTSSLPPLRQRVYGRVVTNLLSAHHYWFHPTISGNTCAC